MVEPQRVKDLNDTPERSASYVLYWMQQCQRASFNPALETHRRSLLECRHA
jgi:deoxyribodipyrimidine photo-lyase